MTEPCQAVDAGGAGRASPAGLGLDVGGTRTRWALADGTGTLLAEGSVAGLTALLMGSEAGREQLANTLGALARDLRALGWGQPERVVAGFSGYSGDAGLRARLEALVAHALGLSIGHTRVTTDVALACLSCFAPGEGYLVYAGTGSIAVFIDQAGDMHRAGGHGSLIDDGGSGYWIAMQALRHVWRARDESPGQWRDSPLALGLFARLGGPQWPRTRDFVYQGSRGQIGELALAVAEAAHAGDAVAWDILSRAGAELARLAQVLLHRHGVRPVALAGRAAQLHPAIATAMRNAIQGQVVPQVLDPQAHAEAARLAATDDPILHALLDTPTAPDPTEPPAEPPRRRPAGECGKPSP